MKAAESERPPDKSGANAVAAEIKALGPHIHPPVPNPAPLCLYCFGLTTALLTIKHTKVGGDSLQEMEGTDIVVMGFAVFFGGLLQLLGGLNEVKRNNVFGYTAFTIYGAFWMSVGLGRIVQLLAPNVKVEMNPIAMQAMLALMGTITFVFLVCTFVMNFTISLLVFLLMMTFYLLAGGVFNETVDKVGGWFGLATAIVAYWLGTVELINDVIGGGRDLIPLGHWPTNAFKIGAFHVPGRIHGVTHRSVLTHSERRDPETGVSLVVAGGNDDSTRRSLEQGSCDNSSEENLSGLDITMRA